MHENMFRHQTLDSQTFKKDGWALIEVGFVTTFFLFKGHTLVLQNIDCWFSNDPLKLRVKISAALKPKKKIDFLLHYGILGSRRDPPGMYGSREVLVVWRWPTPHPLGRRSQRGLWPGAPLLWQKTDHPLQYLPPRSLLSGAYRLKQRLRHFVEELRLRYVHSLSHLSATDDPQYAGVPTGEIKLPDTRLHHCRAPARRTAGRRVFNHACFTGPPRLVKSWWPLMTKGIAGVMKRNGPRGERIGGRWSSRWGRWRCNCREEIGTLSNERKGWKKGEGGSFSQRPWLEWGWSKKWISIMRWSLHVPVQRTGLPPLHSQAFWNNIFSPPNGSLFILFCS